MEQLWCISNKRFINLRAGGIVSVHLGVTHRGSTLLPAASGTHCCKSLVSHFSFAGFRKFWLIEKHKSIVMENNGAAILIASRWSCSCSQGETLAEKLWPCDGSLGMSAGSLSSCLIHLSESIQGLQWKHGLCFNAENIKTL